MNAIYGSRLLLATVCGLVIGIERSFRRKEAGVRTHALFALSSALYMILSKYAFFDLAGDLHADPTMIACQIVMGFNFLAAGIIFRNQAQFASGLTTAAGLWATVAIGMACGAGMDGLGILATGLLIGLQLWIHRFNIGGTAYPIQEIRLTAHNTPAVWTAFGIWQRKHKLEILSAHYRRDQKANTVTMILQTRSPKAITMEEALRFYDKNDEVLDISV